MDFFSERNKISFEFCGQRESKSKEQRTVLFVKLNLMTSLDYLRYCFDFKYFLNYNNISAWMFILMLFKTYNANIVEQKYFLLS
jgi:hypothetical protein